MIAEILRLFRKSKCAKEHLLEKIPVSEVCRKHNLQPTQFYKWQKQFFENGSRSFEVVPPKPKIEPLQAKITQLEEKLTRKNERIDGDAFGLKKVAWGTLKGGWVEPDVRDAIVDYLSYWSQRASFPISNMLRIIGLAEQKFYEWKSKYGEPCKHNGSQPKDFWLTDEEKGAIIEYARNHSESGYRRMCYEMMDREVAAVSPTTVFRILRDNGLLNRFARPSPTKKGVGFEQPLMPNEHWHIDISYLNICGTFYYLCSVLDGYSRKIIAWEIAETMTEAQVEIIIERGKEQYPEARPRIISDNGAQFIARDFKEYLKISGMTQVRTSVYYPQSNGKIERFHQTLKRESIRHQVPLTLKNAIKIAGEYIEKYNSQRLHSAIGYITPDDKMAGRAEEIWRARDEKLEAARRKRKKARAASPREAALINKTAVV